MISRHPARSVMQQLLDLIIIFIFFQREFPSSFLVYVERGRECVCVCVCLCVCLGGGRLKNIIRR